MAKEPAKEPGKKWSDSRMVVELGADLRAQLRALSDATETPMSQVAKTAVEGFVKGRKGFREKVIEEMARKLGVEVGIKGKQ